MSVLLKIADAIQTADKSYFFEDYTKQAMGVMQHLKGEGYAIVPRKPDAAMIEAGMQCILKGRIRPEELIENIWTAMSKQADRG